MSGKGANSYFRSPLSCMVDMVYIPLGEGMLVSIDTDGFIRTYRRNSVNDSWKIYKEWAAHGEGQITCIAALPDCSFVTAGRDRCINRWQTVTGSLLFTIENAHGKVPTCLTYIPRESTLIAHLSQRDLIGGNTLIVLSRTNDGEIKLWDIGTGERLGKMERGFKSTVSPLSLKDKTFVCAESEKICVVVANDDGTHPTDSEYIFEITKSRDGRPENCSVTTRKLSGHPSLRRGAMTELSNGWVISGGDGGLMIVWDIRCNVNAGTDTKQYCPGE